MDSVLHVEPITRQAALPLEIGHMAFVPYGNQLSTDGENELFSNGSLALGCPLETPDIGSASGHTQVPLIKTVEYGPDFTRDAGLVYSENIYLQTKQKHLIPIRTKIRSGYGSVTRLTHLPSLNAARRDLVGSWSPVVCDPRSELVTDILLRDATLRSSDNQELQEWVTNELSPRLSDVACNRLSFDRDDYSSMVSTYTDRLHKMPWELTVQSLQGLASAVLPVMNMTPSSYLVNTPLRYTTAELRNRLVSTPGNFRSLGAIPIGKYQNILHNPQSFSSVCNLLDNIPISDFNVVIVQDVTGHTIHYHEYLALDRFGMFDDSDHSLYQPSPILQDYFDDYHVSMIIALFERTHPDATPEIQEILRTQAVKLRIVKTITDEACILLYEHNTDDGAEPLLGVYFDIALWSLAPLNITSEPIFN